MTPPQTTTCVICQRAVYAAHVDAEGRCVYCHRKPAPARPAPAYEIRWHEFTTPLAPDVKGWFHHADSVLALLEAERPLTCVEIGSYRGASAIPQAITMATWGGELTCIDPWEALAGSYEAIQANIARYGCRNIELWRLPSVEGAARWVAEGREAPDWVYVDGDHTDEAVTADLTAWWPLLAEGGLILGDDYGNPDYPGVARAWNRFGADKGLETERGPNTWGLVWIRKGRAPLGAIVGARVEVAA